MLGEVFSVSLDNIIEKVAKKKVEGYRFVTMSCAELDENTIDILYHLDKDLKLINFRLTVPRNTAIPSISPVYFAAFLVENEMQDLFDVRFTGLVIDYERTLYLEEDVKITPFCKYSISEANRKKSISSVPSGGS
jgi:ech hydrogenase subunit D